MDSFHSILFVLFAFRISHITGRLEQFRHAPIDFLFNSLDLAAIQKSENRSNRTWNSSNNRNQHYITHSAAFPIYSPRRSRLRSSSASSSDICFGFRGISAGSGGGSCGGG